ASSRSQRAIVAADAAQTPRSITKRCSSAREKRDSGRPCSLGSAQATAFTAAICSGGKTARAARALPVIEPGHALLEEALPPASDHLGRRLQPARDLGIATPFGRVQDHLRPLHLLVRPRVASDASFQLNALLIAQCDHEP